MPQPLDLSRVPVLPQTALLSRVAASLSEDASVVALWLGGSFARGAGDVHSDVDLRIAMNAASYRADRLPDGARALADQILVRQRLEFGADGVLHHLMLRDGAIYDLLIQTADRPLPPERRLVLACRDDGLLARLLADDDPPPPTFPSADPAAIRATIEGFWLGLRKHRKVLHRGLDLLAWEGQHRLAASLFRLYHLQATGTDCGPPERLTIHALSPAVRAVQTAFGVTPLAILGSPTRSGGELVRSILAVAGEVARVGRQLADRFGFDYPAEAENVARGDVSESGAASRS